MSGGGKILFRDLKSWKVSHVKLARIDVSIATVIRNGSKNRVVNYLRDRGKMDAGNQKGKGKYETGGMG